jgi:hypothetical protein
LAGVIVTGTGGQATAVTDSDGNFTFTGVVGYGLLFQKENYRFAFKSSGMVEPVDVKMQRAMGVAIGTPLRGLIFPDDVEYTLEGANMWWDEDYFCAPCRYVGIMSLPSSPKSFRLTWSGRQPLRLTAGEYYGNGPTLIADAMNGSSELTGTFRGNVEVALVGLPPLNGRAQTITQPIEFTLTVK